MINVHTLYHRHAATVALTHNNCDWTNRWLGVHSTIWILLVVTREISFSLCILIFILVHWNEACIRRAEHVQARTHIQSIRSEIKTHLFFLRIQMCHFSFAFLLSHLSILYCRTHLYWFTDCSLKAFRLHWIRLKSMLSQCNSMALFSPAKYESNQYGEGTNGRKKLTKKKYCSRNIANCYLAAADYGQRIYQCRSVAALVCERRAQRFRVCVGEKVIYFSHIVII